MLVTKKINNNVAVCVDGNGRELVAFGKGIGFPAMPYELTDLSLIDHSFYRVDPQYWPLFDSIPAEVISFTDRVVDETRDWLPYDTAPNTVITLADHIAFSVQRARQGVYIQMPSLYQLEEDYPQEVKVGKYIVAAVKKRFDVTLPPSEASGIAMHFINARNYPVNPAQVEEAPVIQYEEVLEDTVRIVEGEMGISIQRDTFNYRRFATHLEYLLKRMFKAQHIDTDNQQMYQMMRQEYPDVARCVDKIADCYKDRLAVELTGEERLYLIMHVNRICAKNED